MRFNTCVGVCRDFLSGKVVLFRVMEKAVPFVNVVASLFSAFYVFGMFIYPLFYGGFNWDYVHGVWYTWQALNVGVLAFISSVIAFNISRHHVERQRERNFIAARAFLPHALSDLCEYFVASVPVLLEAYGKSLHDRKGMTSSMKSSVPRLPDSYAEVFKECIRNATPEVGEYLAGILRLLQVHHSRMNRMQNEFSAGSEYYLSCMFSLAKMQVLINQLFDYARGELDFNYQEFTWEQFKTAYRNLDIRFEDIAGLEEFTRRRI